MLIALSGVYSVVGLASLAGGYIGFKKAGSKASLIAGGVSGVALLVAAGCAAASAETLALALGGATSLLLAGRFVPGYLKTKKAMPHGMMAGFSALSLIMTALALV